MALPLSLLRQALAQSIAERVSHVLRSSSPCPSPLRGRGDRNGSLSLSEGEARGEDGALFTNYPRSLAFPRSALLETITSMSSCQDFTKDFAPSSWSWAASASTSTPALANCASTSSQSPPSAGRIAPRSP